MLTRRQDISGNASLDDAARLGPCGRHSGQARDATPPPRDHRLVSRRGVRQFQARACGAVLAVAAARRYTPAGNRPTRCPSGGIGRRSGLRQCNLSPRGEILEVEPVKLGEDPEPRARVHAEPSPGSRRGRCREQTAGTYGRKATVKACSRPRTSRSFRAGGESRSGTKIRRLNSVSVRLRPRAPLLCRAARMIRE